MRRGYIKLWRKVVDNKLYFCQPFTKMQAWIDMVLITNYKDRFIYVRGIPILIKRGQLLGCERWLGERWKWSRGKVRRFLQNMGQQTSPQISIQKNNVCSIITITNYEQYQPMVELGGTLDSTTSSTTNGPQTDLPNNIKNIKKDKNIIHVRFNELWMRYPRRVGKKAAEKHFKTSVKNEEDWTHIQVALDNYLKSRRVKNGYIQNGSTWFNNWQDWIEYKEESDDDEVKRYLERHNIPSQHIPR